MGVPLTRGVIMSTQSIHILFYHIDAFFKIIEAQNSKVNAIISEPLKPLVVFMKRSTKWENS